jgi:hypothetical protein
MKRKRRPPETDFPKPGAPPPKGKSRGAEPNTLTAPDARWQRFQRYVWDRKKG